MTVLPASEASFDLESSCSSDCDSGNVSDDFPYTQEEVQEIYNELDLDEEGITEEEIARRKRRIFVGGLKFSSEDDVLHEYFQQFGKIREAAVIKERKMGPMSKGYGLSKGYGFVSGKDWIHLLSYFIFILEVKIITALLLFVIYCVKCIRGQFTQEGVGCRGPIVFGIYIELYRSNFHELKVRCCALLSKKQQF